MKSVKRFLTIVLTFALLITSVPVEKVFAATEHSIAFVDAGGSSLSTLTVTDGNAIGTLPAVTDLLLWVDELGNTVSSATIPTQNMSVMAVTTTDVTAQGTLDGGNLTWFIVNNHLYVTGTGTIGTIPEYMSTGSTKRYGLSLGDIQVENPDIMYTWLYAPSVGDEQDGGYGAFEMPTDPSMTVSLNISRPISITGQTIGYPHSTLSDYIPWVDYASNIREITFAETVSLDGNFSLYFNANSSSIAPSSLNESIYENLEYIYMFADTSDVVQMGGMYARIPSLKGVYTVSGSSYGTSSCWDMSGMFYGDELLTSEDITYGNYILTSIVNAFSDVSSVTDMRYMFFDCKSLYRPNIGLWDTSSLLDTSYMFTGCNRLCLKLAGSGEAYDISDWDMSHVYSTTGMFAGSEIDLTASNPLSNLWGLTTSTVVVGDINLDLWDLSNNQVSVFMFAQNHGITGITWTGNAPSLVDASAMFAFCDAISDLDMAALNAAALAYIDVFLFNSGADEAVADLSGMVLSALTDARYAFYGTGFKTINLNNTNPALLENAEGMFSQNLKLTSLGSEGLGDWILSALTNAAYMFHGDIALTALSVSAWGMEQAETVDYMFAGCESLGNISVGNWLIDSSLLSANCFMLGCKAMNRVALTSWNANAVTSAFMSFANMTVLKTADISGLKFDALVITNGMFANDVLLEEVTTGNQAGVVLMDAGGMFYNCASLTNLDIKYLVTSFTEAIDYILCGAKAVTVLDISGWDTSNVEYMQCAFDGAEALETLTTGVNFTSGSAVTTAATYRDCESLSAASLQAIIASWVPSSTESIFEMYRNVPNLTTLDLSSKDFSSVETYTNAFWGDTNLDVITIPETFFSGVSSLVSDAANVFYVPVDTLTYLTVSTSGGSLPAKLASYNWSGDNRTFLLKRDACIGTVVGTVVSTVEDTYTFTDSGAESASMVFNVDSIFYLGSNALPVTYEWRTGNSVISGATTDTYTVQRGTTGTFTATASLDDLTYADSLSANFNIAQSSGLSGITAIYTGPTVIVGRDYLLDDLTVKKVATDGTETILSATAYSVNSKTVTNAGNNTFTVTYTDSFGGIWSADFVVPGHRVIGSVSAAYTGEDIPVGSNYDKNDVVLIAYYADDSEHSEGFLVTPSLYSETTVSSVGDNTFTVYYIDASNNNNQLSDTFTVTGYVKKEIASISATYSGNDILVGSTYSKDDVDVTVRYTDGTSALITNFTLNSLKVENLGTNTFVATVIDNDGDVFSSSFNVKGVPLAISYITATYVGDEILVGKSYSKDDVNVTAVYKDGTSAKISSFTLSSTEVSKVGTNTYTVTVTSDDGNAHTATIKVTGYKLSNVKSIEAVYNGPTIQVGKKYDKSDVTVTVKFSDGTADMKLSDFTVNSSTVSRVGSNEFTAYVTDSSGKVYSDTFLVKGAQQVASNTTTNLGVQTGESNDILGIVLCLVGFILLLVVILYVRNNRKRMGA